MNNLKYIANHLYQLHIAVETLCNNLQKKEGKLHRLIANLVWC